MTPPWMDILKAVGWPTQVVVLDWETYADKDYNLKKMSAIEYVQDARFEELGVATLLMDQPYAPVVAHFWHDVPRHLAFLQQRYGQNFERCTVVWQNGRFDGTVLARHHNIHPCFAVDIRDLANQLNPRRSNSLAAMAERHGLKPKGDTQQFFGLHWKRTISLGKLRIPIIKAGMTDEQKTVLFDYACHDDELEWQLFTILLPQITRPEFELPLALHTHRLFWQPKIAFDSDAATQLIADMEEKIDTIAGQVGRTRKELSGNNSFVRILQDALPEGESVPFKQGKKKLVPALAKTDPELLRLKEHPDGIIRNLVAARQAIKSWPLHAARVARMQAHAGAEGTGRLPVPLLYCGAHTGRWTGGERINLQNLSARSSEPLILRIRGLLVPPAGHSFVIADASQVEARGTGWIAGQWDLIESFASGAQIYCEFASEVLGKKIRKPLPGDAPALVKYLKHYRQFGKVGILGCLAAGTPIFTMNGWKPIEEVQINDQVWDGENWVSHAGVICQGKRMCQKINGMWLTPDHEIYFGNEWYQVQDLNTDNPKWGINTVILSYLPSNMGNEAGLSPSNAVAPVVESLLRTEIIWSPENLHAAMCVLKTPLVILKRLCPNFWMSPAMHDWLVAFVTSFSDAIKNHRKIIPDMADGESEYGESGWRIKELLLDTLCPYLDEITPNLKLTVLTIIEDTNQKILDLQRGNSNVETRNLTTYDILAAGPNRRFQAGNLLCGNCGYGMGWERCMIFARDQYGIILSPALAKRLVNHYREKYKKICRFWRDIENAFKFVTRYPTEQCDLPRGLHFRNENNCTFITLPSGRDLRYEGARVEGTGHDEVLKYPNQRKHTWIYMWGGFLTENIIQAICRDLLAEAMMDLESQGVPTGLHVHDELIAAVPTDETPAALTKAIEALRKRPAWAPELPLDAEGEITDRYGK